MVGADRKFLQNTDRIVSTKFYVSHLEKRGSDIDLLGLRRSDLNGQLVIALELVEGDRTDRAQHKNANDDVTEHAEVIVDGADRAAKAASGRETELIADEVERFEAAPKSS